MSDVKRRLDKLEQAITPDKRVTIRVGEPPTETNEGDAKVVILTIGGIDLQHDL